MSANRWRHSHQRLLLALIWALAFVVASHDVEHIGSGEQQPRVCPDGASQRRSVRLDDGTAECLQPSANAAAVAVADAWNWTAVRLRNNTTAQRSMPLGRIAAHQQATRLRYETERPNATVADTLNATETDEHDLLRTLAGKVLSWSKPFDAGRSAQASSRCKAHVRRYLDALGQFDMWAVGMYDASAKLPTGILSGNINHLGNFDQCLAVDSAHVEDAFGQVPEPGQPDDDAAAPTMTSAGSDPVRGKYCLAYVQPMVPTGSQPRLRRLHGLIQSHGAFRSDFDDPGHRVPRFSMINWALCVPDACSASDVESALHESLAELTAGTGIRLNARVEDRMCQQAEPDRPFDRNTRLAMGFFAAIVAWTLIATVIDYSISTPNPYLVAFSLRKNVRALCSLERAPTDISAIHGIRFVNAFMLVVSHKSMALFFDPYVNRTQMSESLGQPWTVIGRAAAIYTDVFLMFSGLLTAYSLFGRLRRGQPARIGQDYVGRLMRIVPTFGALILFCTYVLPNMSSGPQWQLVVGHHADICKEHWWKNMLFIHNYFGFENMCLTHTHHLGIDTELFALAPLVVLSIWRWPRRAIAGWLAVAAWSTIGRYYVSVAYSLSNYVYFGASIKLLFRTADLMYAIPFYRATIYLLGILLGYVLHVCKGMRLTESQLKWGWTVSSVLFAAVFLGPAPMGSISYVYNAHHAAVYAALGPMAWCGLFAWIVFTTHLGHRSRLGDAMSWRGFQVTTRLSYGIYLTQFPVFFYNVGRRRFASHYEFLAHTLNVHEWLFIVLTAVALTLLFESPFQNIKKCWFRAPAKLTPARIDASAASTMLATEAAHEKCQ